MRPLRLAAALALAGLACAGPARAQFQGLVSLPPLGNAESRLLLGGAGILRPAYLGSDDRVWTLLPLVDYRHRNGVFASTNTGLGWSLIDTPQAQFGLRVIPRFGRDQDTSSDLLGMGDIPPGVEGSVFATYSPTRDWTLGLNLRGGNRGAEIDFGARRDLQLGRFTRMSVTGFGTVANTRSNQVWYGVDADQSVASGYALYEPSGGLRNLQLAATVNHFFGGRWVAIGGLGLGRLVGDAADSPLVRERTHWGGFAAIGYQLW
jgi:outer membrane scaffolding protein for murein synthesis (MipA/OmpV family)